MNYKQLAQRFRVSLGFVIAPLFLLSARPTIRSLIVGGLVAILGLGIRAWASGHLRKNERLTITGPYAHTRNPLYFGTFILATGLAVAGGTIWFAAVFVVLYLLIYVPVMLAEAETVMTLFPDSYDEYRRNVPLFVPRLTRYVTPNRTGDSTSRYAVSQYLKHREYRAAIGVAATFGLLIAKYVILR